MQHNGVMKVSLIEKFSSCSCIDAGTIFSRLSLGRRLVEEKVECILPYQK